MYVTKLISLETQFNLQASEWALKRDTLLVQLNDIPVLASAYLHRGGEPYKNNPQITLRDSTPAIRLASACEASANCLYSIAEIASNFANKASDGRLPSSFNSIRKMCEKDPSLPVAVALGDLQWYRKVREFRTEWAHYSSIFVSDANGIVEIGMRAFRRPSDKLEFRDTIFICRIQQFVGWVENALSTLDTFAGYLLKTFVVPKMQLDSTFLAAVYDENGFPRTRADHTFVVETISVREFLRRGGISVDS